MRYDQRLMIDVLLVEIHDQKMIVKNDWWLIFYIWQWSMIIDQWKISYDG